MALQDISRECIGQRSQNEGAVDLARFQLMGLGFSENAEMYGIKDLGVQEG